MDHAPPKRVDNNHESSRETPSLENGEQNILWVESRENGSSVGLRPGNSGLVDHHQRIDVRLAQRVQSFLPRIFVDGSLIVRICSPKEPSNLRFVLLVIAFGIEFPLSLQISVGSRLFGEKEHPFLDFR